MTARGRTDGPTGRAPPRFSSRTNAPSPPPPPPPPYSPTPPPTTRPPRRPAREPCRPERRWGGGGPGVRAAPAGEAVAAGCGPGVRGQVLGHRRHLQKARIVAL